MTTYSTLLARLPPPNPAASVEYTVQTLPATLRPRSKFPWRTGASPLYPKKGTG
jgi:hypothetical protein